MINATKPNFFIAGAAKAGTTALWSYLSQHPDIFLSKVKEPHYFFLEKSELRFREDFKNRLGKGNQHQRFINSLEEYLELFPKSPSEKIIGEASASYLYSEKAAKAIFDFNPDAKVLIILRDPIERAFSHYLMNRRMGFSNLSFIDDFKKDLRKEEKGWGMSHLYLELGLYSEQLKRYISTFPEENLMIILHEELKMNSLEQLNKIAEFLKIERFDFKTESRANQAMLPRNRMLLHWAQSSGLGKVLPGSWISSLKGLFYNRKNLPQLEQKDRKELLPFFRQDIIKLETLIDKDLKSWYNE